MSGRLTLRVGWCDRAAAEFAVMRWHYSRTMPVSPAVYLGVWEDGAFSGTIIYAKGANYRLNQYFSVEVTEAAELVRVALKPGHRAPVSRVLKFALAMLRQQSPGLRVLVSYADANEGHHGGIYQAAGWTYLGLTSATKALEINGKTAHKRAFTGTNYGKPAKVIPASARMVDKLPKHRYALGLDDAMKAWLQARARPYPKRAASIDVDAPVHQTGEAGSPRAPRSHEAGRG